MNGTRYARIVVKPANSEELAVDDATTTGSVR
jgi:hypothetical protein